MNRVLVDILRNLMTFNEIIQLKYQVGIIINISPHPKYLLVEEGFIELFINNIPMI